MMTNFQQAKDYLKAEYERRHKRQPSDEDLVQFCLMEWGAYRQANPGKSGAALLGNLKERITK